LTSGRKPSPTALKLVKGNPGKRALNKKEAKLDLAEPTPPEFLNTDAKVEWGRVVGTLYRAGLMTELDRAVLAAYCQAYGRWAQAERALSRMADKDEYNRALMVKTHNGTAIQNPLVGTANKAKADMVRYALEFGMTPSARSKVNATPHEQSAEDITKEFFG
jgi:P27 family predicted phage terminase small subunit